MYKTVLETQRENGLGITSDKVREIETDILNLAISTTTESVIQLNFVFIVHINITTFDYHRNEDLVKKKYFTWSLLTKPKTCVNPKTSTYATMFQRCMKQLMNAAIPHIETPHNSVENCLY